MHASAFVLHLTRRPDLIPLFGDDDDRAAVVFQSRDAAESFVASQNATHRWAIVEKDAESMVSWLTHNRDTNSVKWICSNPDPHGTSGQMPIDLALALWGSFRNNHETPSE
jgi:hypothetical protein